MPAAGSFYDHVAAWLAKQPALTTAASGRGGVRPRRRVTEPLARMTLNRIRRATLAKPGWQEPRWRRRHKRTGAMKPVRPMFDAKGIEGLLPKNYRLILAHTHGDRLRLRATLSFLNSRVDTHLSDCCFGGRPHGTGNGTDRRAALKRFQRLVWIDGYRWVAKLDVKQFFDTLPHDRLLAALEALVADRGCFREVQGYLAWYWAQRWPQHSPPPGDPAGTPQGSPISGMLANAFMTPFDKALEEAHVPFIRYLDDITVAAEDHKKLLDHIGRTLTTLEKLGLSLAPEKTRVAYLGEGRPRVAALDLPPRAGGRRRVDKEFDLLGIHFFSGTTFRVRRRTVKRLLTKVQAIIARNPTARPVGRYIRATAAINKLLGYQLAEKRPGSKKPQPPRAMVRAAAPAGRDPPTDTCWIARARYVQPRQHAVLGHSDLILAQMHRVDRLIRRWMKAEFAGAIGRLRGKWRTALHGRRVRSAAKMFEIAVRDATPPCTGGACP